MARPKSNPGGKPPTSSCRLGHSPSRPGLFEGAERGSEAGSVTGTRSRRRAVLVGEVLDRTEVAARSRPRRSRCSQPDGAQDKQPEPTSVWLSGSCPGPAPIALEPSPARQAHRHPPHGAEMRGARTDSLSAASRKDLPEAESCLTYRYRHTPRASHDYLSRDHRIFGQNSANSRSQGAVRTNRLSVHQEQSKTPRSRLNGLCRRL